MPHRQVYMCSILRIRTTALFRFEGILILEGVDCKQPNFVKDCIFAFGCMVKGYCYVILKFPLPTSWLHAR